METAVAELWDDLQIVDDAADLAFLKKKPKIAEKLAPFTDDGGPRGHPRGQEAARRTSGPSSRSSSRRCSPRPRALATTCPSIRTSTPAGCPIAPGAAPSACDGIEAVIQLHRLREVLALVGFTRFEAVTPDINGEYETDVERAQIALEPQWFPAVENRGEGVFVQLRADAVKSWLGAAGGQAAARRPRERAPALDGGPQEPSARSRVARTCCCTRSRTS